MKTLLTFFLSSFVLLGADRVFLDVTITNQPATGDALTFSQPASRTILWTNTAGPTGVVTNDVAGSATNLYLYFGANPIGAPRLVVQMVATNAIRLYGEAGQLIAAATNNWAQLAYSTQSVQRSYPVRVPVDVEFSTNRAVIANGLVQGINDYATTAFSNGAPALAHYVSLTSSQVVSNKHITGSILSNSVVHATGGSLVNVTSSGMVATNFNAPGSGSGSLQIGDSANAAGEHSTAIGNGAIALGVSDVSLGTAAECGYGNGVALGTSAAVNAESGVAIGAGSIVGVNHYGSVAIGYFATTSRSNQVTIGGPLYTVRIPGRLEAATLTNDVHVGTNQQNGILRYAVQTVSTLAAGNNTMPALTSALVEITTTGGAFAIVGIPAGAAGQVLTLVNLTGQNLTIAHESGVDPTAGNRIITMTSADTATVANGVAELYYSASQSRWILTALDP
jgi:hypothetical protein